MSHYESYIICTTPRSGSTLLCKLLTATGISGVPDSHFHSPHLSDWMRYYALSPDSYSNEHDLINAIFRAARRRGTGDTPIFGLRMQRGSFDFFMQKLLMISTNNSTDSDAERIQAAFGKTLFIHLTRENKLEQAISLVKATQTGLWHKAPDGTELERQQASQEPVYDAEAIEREMDRLTTLEALWNTWFSEQTIEPLRISYDDLSATPIEVVNTILKGLNIQHDVSHTSDMPVAKLADASSLRWAKRFLDE